MRETLIPGIIDYRLEMGVLFFLALCSDYADGKIARAFGWESPFGKVLDPIADKLLCWAVILNYVGVHPTWNHWLPALFIAGYDLAILGLRSFGLLLEVLRSAKWKTFVLMAAMGFAFLDLMGVSGMYVSQVALGLLWLSGVMVIISGSFYVRHLTRGLG